VTTSPRGPAQPPCISSAAAATAYPQQQHYHHYHHVQQTSPAAAGGQSTAPPHQATSHVQAHHFDRFKPVVQSERIAGSSVMVAPAERVQIKSTPIASRRFYTGCVSPRNTGGPGSVQILSVGHAVPCPQTTMGSFQQVPLSSAPYPARQDAAPETSRRATVIGGTQTAPQVSCATSNNVFRQVPNRPL